MHMATTSAKATMEIIDINKGYLVTEYILTQSQLFANHQSG